MIPPIPPTPPTQPGPSALKGVSAGQGQASAASPGGFATALGDAVTSLQSSQVAAQKSALGVAVGTTSLSAAMIASTTAELGTQLTVAIANAAVTSFNQVMAI